MGMGMKSLKWEGIGTKNLFPHTSSPSADTRFSSCKMELQICTSMHLKFGPEEQTRFTVTDFTPNLLRLMKKAGLGAN